jgi:hypothetical protein
MYHDTDVHASRHEPRSFTSSWNVEREHPECMCGVRGILKNTTSITEVCASARSNASMQVFVCAPPRSTRRSRSSNSKNCVGRWNSPRAACDVRTSDPVL